MPNYRRWRHPGGTYFFTVNLADRLSDLLVKEIDPFRAVVQNVRRDHPFDIVAAVVLPDHLHMLWSLPPDDAEFSKRWSLIKAGFSRGVPKNDRRSVSRARKGERGVWQRRFYEHLCRDEDDIRAHIDYIHFNPVKHGLVKRPADWPHSSIHRFIRRGQLPADWSTSTPPSAADHDWG